MSVKSICCFIKSQQI